MVLLSIEAQAEQKRASRKCPKGQCCCTTRGSGRSSCRSTNVAGYDTHFASCGGLDRTHRHHFFDLVAYRSPTSDRPCGARSVCGLRGVEHAFYERLPTAL